MVSGSEGELTQILALWAHPRARSSAVGRMMCERGDFCVKDEPFMGYHYFSDERVSWRRNDVEPNPKYRFDVILKNLLRETQSKPVFIKDHAYHVISRASPESLRHFRSTFLIRHPAQALPSLYAKMPDFTLHESGYASSLRLFEMVNEMEGKPPVVIDADDLVERPEDTIRAYCEAVEIPFIRRALHWSSRLPAALDADWGGWYAHLEKSCGFARQSNPDYVRVEDNETTRKAYDYCLPLYRTLHHHRLRVR